MMKVFRLLWLVWRGDDPTPIVRAITPDLDAHAFSLWLRRQPLPRQIKDYLDWRVYGAVDWEIPF